MAHAAPLPEIQVSVVHFESQNVAVGNVMSLGHTIDGVPFLVDYTITNTGEPGSSLELSNATVPGGFSIVQAPAAAVAAGQSTTMRLRCDATAVGDFMGLVSIDTNDADEDPFSFTVSCSVNATGTPGLLALWSQAAGGELEDDDIVEVAAGAGARIWARDILGAPAPLQLLPVVVAPQGPQVGAWSPGSVTATVPVSFTLSCADEAGAPLVGSYQVTVEESVFHQTVTFELSCVDADLPVGGSNFTALGLLVGAALLALGGSLLFAGRRRFVTSA